jgi:hypothetical protein
MSDVVEYITVKHRIMVHKNTQINHSGQQNSLDLNGASNS